MDYPIYASPPDTGFSCDGKQGLYSDTASQCQAWHVCLDLDRQWSFLCPNGTIFNQEIFTCVWWFDFDCNTAESFYSLNDDLYSEVSGGGQGQSESRPAAGGGGELPVVSGSGGRKRPQGGGNRKSQGAGGSRRRQQQVKTLKIFDPDFESFVQGGVTAEPGLVLVIPGLDDDDEDILPGYRSDRRG